MVHDNVIDKPADIRDAIFEHFSLHFNNSHAVSLKKWSGNMRTLSANSSVLLEQPFSEDEVWDVISKSDGNKAPSPNRFNMHFIKNHWVLIKDDVMKIFELFF